MNVITQSLQALKNASSLHQQQVFAQQLLQQVGAMALIQYALENNDIYACLVLDPSSLTPTELASTSQYLNQLDDSRRQAVVSVINKLGNQFAKAFCQNEATVRALGQHLLSGEANSWLSTAVETSLYGLRRTEIMPLLTQVCCACLSRPMYAGNEAYQLKARCDMTRLVSTVPAESFQFFFQAAQAFIQSHTLETTELLTQVIQRLDLAKPEGREFLSRILRFFNGSAHAVASLSYEQMKAVVELQCSTAVWAVNKRAYTLELLLEVLEQFAAVFMQHDSHYIFLQLLTFLQKLYDQRPLSTLFVLCQQYTKPELRWQQEYVLLEMITNFTQAHGISIEEMQRLAQVLPACNQLVLQRCQYFMSKEPVMQLLCGVQNNFNSLQFALEDYAFSSTVQWQDWFAFVKLQSMQLVTKLTTLFPNDAVQFVSSALQQLWPMVYQTQELITMNSAAFYTVDVVNSMYEEISACIVKLTLHENDFGKTRLLDFQAFTDMCQLALSDQVEREISHQNICVYRHLSAVSDIVKFIQKFNVQIDAAAQDKKVSVDQNCRILYGKYRTAIKPIVGQALATLINAIDFRSTRYGEQDMNGNLYTMLSQDTLAVRRAVATKLCSYFSSPYVTWMLLTDDKDQLNKPVFDGISSYLEHLISAGRLTEKEQIDVTTARINLLISLRQLGLAAEGDYLDQTLSAILQKQIDYFSRVQSVLSQGISAFAQAFHIDLNAPPVPVTHDVIREQRGLKFKLQETRLVVLHVVAAFQDAGVIAAAEQILGVCEALFTNVCQIAVSQTRLPPEFVFQCNPFKINLTLAQEQHLQVDVDDPQAFITQDQYQIEWLDSVFELLALILVQSGRVQFVLQQTIQLPSLLVHYQKNLAVTVVKGYNPGLFGLFWQLAVQNIQKYAAVDVYTQVPQHVNPSAALSLVTSQMTHDQLVDQTTAQIICRREDLAQEQLQQIGYSCYIVGLRAWVDLLQKIIYDQKDKKFDTGFVQNYNETVLNTLMAVTVICEQDQRSLLAMLNLLVLLVQMTPVHVPLFCQVLFTCYVQNKNQTTLRELIVNILGTILSDDDQVWVTSGVDAILSLVKCKRAPPQLPTGAELKKGLVEWLTWLEDEQSEFC